MGCTIQGHKTFLIVCNIGLLFSGLSILILGMKMKGALTSLRLDQFPTLLQTAKAVVASGFFIAVTGGTGFSAACYEVLWLIYVHLSGLGVIITMEFALGIVLMVVKNTIETFMASEDCGELCGLTLKTLVLDLAIPAAGLMMSIIIVQAIMVYSALQLYYYLKDKPKDTLAGPTILVQNMQMQNVVSQPFEPTYPSPQPMCAPPHAGYSPYHAPPELRFSPVQPGHDLALQQPYAASPIQQVNFPDDPNVDPPPYAEVGSRTGQLSGQEETIQPVVYLHNTPQSAEPRNLPTIQLPSMSKSC